MTENTRNRPAGTPVAMSAPARPARCGRPPVSGGDATAPGGEVAAGREMAAGPGPAPGGEVAPGGGPERHPDRCGERPEGTAACEGAAVCEGTAGGSGKASFVESGSPGVAVFPAVFAELFRPHRFKVFYGGRGGGKSRNFARALLLIGAERPIRVLCAREIQNSLRDSVKRLLDDEIDRLGLSGFYRSTESGIRGCNGTLFVFSGLRVSPERIKSFEGLTHCWIEEAETVSERSLDLLIPTMRAEGSEIWMSFNPDRVNAPVWQRFVVRKPPPGSYVRKVGWRDNPWFPDVLRAEMEHCRQSDPDRYEHVWEGNPVLVEAGSYYGRLLRQAEEAGRIGEVPVEPNLLVHTAWDLGMADATAIWFFQVLPVGSFGEWRFVDFHEGSGEGLLHYAEVLAARGYRYGMHIGPHDLAVRELGTGKSRIETARGLGLNFTTAPLLSVADGIESARQVLASAWFDRSRCGAGLEALWAYRRERDEARDCFRERPLHDWTSHAADAFRYAAVGYRRPATDWKPLVRKHLRVC